MCFSATSSFLATGVIAVIGIATLRHVREPRSLLFASVPMLFALHQFCEGLVWLGLNGRIGQVALGHVVFLFMLYAQGILPLLMPAAVVLMEPTGWRRGAIMTLTLVGSVVCAWDVYGLVAFPSTASVDHHSIVYANALTANLVISCLYILATCGALLLSTHHVVRAYGVVNIIVLSIVEVVKANAFASVWCFYAAIMSIMIYRQFNQRRININTPNSSSLNLRPYLLTWLRRSHLYAAC